MVGASASGVTWRSDVRTWTSWPRTTSASLTSWQLSSYPTSCWGGYIAVTTRTRTSGPRPLRPGEEGEGHAEVGDPCRVGRPADVERHRGRRPEQRPPLHVGDDGFDGVARGDQ